MKTLCLSASPGCILFGLNYMIFYSKWTERVTSLNRVERKTNEMMSPIRNLFNHHSYGRCCFTSIRFCEPTLYHSLPNSSIRHSLMTIAFFGPILFIRFLCEITIPGQVCFQGSYHPPYVWLDWVCTIQRNDTVHSRPTNKTREK